VERVDRTLRGAAAIVGVADDVSPTGELDRTGRELEVAMVLDALGDAGLTLADVDGVCHPESAVAFAEYLGVHPVFTESTMTGGSSYEVQVEHAAAAIAAGVCDVVVSVYAATPRSDRTRRRGGGGGGGGGRFRPGPNLMMEWELPYGLRIPMGPYALAAARHMHEFGTTSEQLAQIAVSTREWATLNPRARYRDPLTVADVLASPLQVSPLHLLDCCLVTDGAGAFVMTSAARARTLRKPPVYVLGAATATDHMMIDQMPDLTVTPGVVSGTRAFAMAGLTPDDVDVLIGYDSFTITALLHLEDLGFCKKGEGGPFAAEGTLGPAGGRLAMNTNGGGLSFTHPGMYGMFLLTEATRQLRGEADRRQVPDAAVAVAHGSGMVLSVMSTAVLGTEAVL
jgi:acetyl-CoA acetyltransferase